MLDEADKYDEMGYYSLADNLIDHTMKISARIQDINNDDLKSRLQVSIQNAFNSAIYSIPECAGLKSLTKQVGDFRDLMVQYTSQGKTYEEAFKLVAQKGNQLGIPGVDKCMEALSKKLGGSFNQDSNMSQISPSAP